MVFVSHVTLRDHVIKALNDFMGRNPLRYVTILPSCGRYRHSDNRETMIFVSHVIKVLDYFIQ